MGALSFQLVSVFEKLECKFESFFIEELNIASLHFNTVYAPIYFKLPSPICREACNVIAR